MKNKDQLDHQTVIAAEVIAERDRQDIKWGRQSYPAAQWLMILGEEVGEVCKAALECTFSYSGSKPGDYREELVQSAAVIMAMIEDYDRRVGNGESVWS